jgi:small GTP-binding protein
VTEPARATRELLLRRADRLGEIASRLGLPDLATAIGKDTRRRLDDATIRAAILGEIKQGKSTLLNALIGHDVLPTGVTPTTGAVVIVHAGREPGPWLDRGSAGREQLENARFTRLARGPLRGGAEATPVEDQGTLEFVVEPGTLPPSLELVDTPGINDIAKFRAALSRGELPHADILVLVLDATQLLNRAEMAFLRDAVAAVGGLASSGARLLIAVNRIDLIAERERPKLVEHLHRELAALGAPADAGEPASSSGAPTFELFLTDARTAARDPGADTPGVQGVRELKARLLELATARAEVLPLRARAGLVRHTTLLGHNAAIASRAMTLEIDSLRKEIKRVEKELADHETDMTALRSQMAAAREELLEQSQERLEAFRAELLESVDQALKTISLRSLSSHFAGAIHDAFLTFAHQESERLRAGLDEITRKAIITHSEQARRRLFHATMRLGFRGPTIYVDPPSVVLEAGLVVVGVAGTAVLYFGNIVAGLLMTIAGPLATLVLREKSLRSARTRARAELPKALDHASEALREQIRRVIDTHLTALDEHLQLANVALGDQLKGVLRAAEAELAKIEPAADRPEGEPGGRARIQRELYALEHELAEIRHELDAFG